MPNNRNPFSEHRRAQVYAAQLAHGIKYQGLFYAMACLAWLIFMIMLSNGTLG